jgi:hypothetical protein
MIRIDASSIASIQQAEDQLQAILEAVTGDGLADIMQLAVLQAHRFVSSNIEVDTGRTKNSVFPEVRAAGNGVEGVLGTNVVYSPWVRDASHSQQFFEYAAEHEGPNIARMFGEQVQIRVESA